MAAFDPDVIGNTARALLAAISPATGVRGTGTIDVTADAGGGAVTVPGNAYLFPVIENVVHPVRLFKTVRNAADENGEYSVPDGGTLSIPVTSNVGGAIHNVPAGSVMRFDPPIAGISAAPTVPTAITNASDAGAVIRRASYFEDVTAAQVTADLFKAELNEYPALAIVWDGSAPVSGLTAGPTQGDTRVRRGKRWFRETYRLMVAGGINTGDTQRRGSVLTAMQTVSALLTDQRCNLDGELLAAIGSGVEVVSRARFTRTARLYVYLLTVRVAVLETITDSRTFNDWVTAQLRMALPGRQAPEPTTPLTIVDVDEPIP